MEKTNKKKATGTTIWLTRREYALIAEGRDLWVGFTGSKISWGAYLCALSIGALAAKSLTGITIRCPDCGCETVMTLDNPMGKRIRKILSREAKPAMAQGSSPPSQSRT